MSIFITNEEYKNWAILSQEKIDGEDKGYEILIKKVQDLSAVVKDPQNTSTSQEEGVLQTVISELSIEDYLWKHIHECAPIKELYDDALKEQEQNESTAKHHIHLKLEDSKTPSDVYDAAAWSDFAEGEITIPLGQSTNQMLSSVVFELTNFKQQKTFSHIDKQAQLGSINADQYAEESEKVEYNGMKMHHDVVQKAVCFHQWDKEIDEYSSVLDSWKTFEDYWKDRKDDDHANFYRAEYDLMNYKFRNLFITA